MKTKGAARAKSSARRRPSPDSTECDFGPIVARTGAARHGAVEVALLRMLSPSRPRWHGRLITGMTLASWLVATPILAQKTDVIILDNGDHLTGEIKGMSLGKLDFSTDDAGRPSIEWIKIARVTSPHAFEVELASGKKLYGPLRAGPGGKDLVVGPEGSQETVPIVDVIAVTPLDERFLSRVRAYLDLGFTLAKAKTAMTLSGDGEVAYRGQHVGAAVSFNTYLQGDENSPTVTRASGLLTADYLFPRWRIQGQFGLDHNDELELRLRTSLGAAVAYSVLRSKAMELWLSGGLVADHAAYFTGEPTFNLAGYGALEWQLFRYDSPKLDAGIEFEILPVLTDFGRVRGTATTRVKYEVFADFNVGLNFSYTFDTRPPDPAAPKTDYLLSATIGWSYHR
jgi:hypothetical protein